MGRPARSEAGRHRALQKSPKTVRELGSNGQNGFQVGIGVSLR